MAENHRIIRHQVTFPDEMRPTAFHVFHVAWSLGKRKQPAVLPHQSCFDAVIACMLKPLYASPLTFSRWVRPFSE